MALVFRCQLVGGEERTSSEWTAVTWITPEVAESMPKVFSIRLRDPLDGAGPNLRSHNGRPLTPARQGSLYFITARARAPAASSARCVQQASWR
ncbi:hypothetical protein Sliba_41010 [Streptomyces nigrescens]|uniref:Uncharacterized protein n=1 Tax=Streptomyces nigrescens TaxID=1920 RepID=A0A640TJP0_STRNI|nr:hypothetical protein Sliba_41010 [Streptomyces libani subsp. libani]GGV93613.1 hypothetical protein GCM10010500_29700 [Streptomyces libani subsp. libani]